jgi:hypothetical protein
MRKHVFLSGLLSSSIAAACSGASSPGGAGGSLGTGASTGTTSSSTTSTGATSSSTTSSSTASTSATSSGGAITFTCYLPNKAQCEAYGFAPAQLMGAQALCTMEMGTAGTTCPTANLIGSCTLVQSGFTSQDYYYTDPANDASQLQAACTMTGGTWTSG